MAVMKILQVIGNTPIVQIERLVPEGAADVYVKLELSILDHLLKTSCFEHD